MYEQQKLCRRFGKVAVELGHISAEQLKAAMNEQVEDSLQERPHRILGAILFDRGWMTHAQIEKVLTEMFREERAAC